VGGGDGNFLFGQESPKVRAQKTKLFAVATAPTSSWAPTAEMASPYVLSIEDVQAAHARIAASIHRTPVLTSSAVDLLASSPDAEPSGGGRRAFFKCELFQKSGSFKARGACNAVALLSDEEAAKGVCTHSSGNHAQALAAAAAMRGIPAHIVMPNNAPRVKVAAVKGYGARVIECAPTQQAREEAAAAVAAETGATFVHPSEDPRVMAGAGTLALELLEQVAAEVAGWSPSSSSSSTAGSSSGFAAFAASLPQPILDAVLVPIGGGGMISGVATAVKAIDPRILVIAAEPAEADDAARSKRAGSIQPNPSPPKTIADGLKTTLGKNTWPQVRDKVDEVVCVSEDEIVRAMRVVYERMKLAIEPSAAVGVAALLYRDEVRGRAGLRRVGVVLCGGNVDLDTLPFKG
jgi:threonine dehydratase